MPRQVKIMASLRTIEIPISNTTVEYGIWDKIIYDTAGKSTGVVNYEGPVFSLHTNNRLLVAGKYSGSAQARAGRITITNSSGWWPYFTPYVDTEVYNVIALSIQFKGKTNNTALTSQNIAYYFSNDANANNRTFIGEQEYTFNSTSSTTTLTFDLSQTAMAQFPAANDSIYLYFVPNNTTWLNSTNITYFELEDIKIICYLLEKNFSNLAFDQITEINATLGQTYSNTSYTIINPHPELPFTLKCIWGQDTNGQLKDTTNTSLLNVGDYRLTLTKEYNAVETDATTTTETFSFTDLEYLNLYKEEYSYSATNQTYWWYHNQLAIDDPAFYPFSSTGDHLWPYIWGYLFPNNSTFIPTTGTLKLILNYVYDNYSGENAGAVTYLFNLSATTLYGQIFSDSNLNLQLETIYPQINLPFYFSYNSNYSLTGITRTGSYIYHDLDGLGGIILQVYKKSTPQDILVTEKDYTGLNILSLTLNEVNEYYVLINLKDTRNNIETYRIPSTGYFVVHDYNSLELTKPIFYRSDSNGNQDYTGTFITCKFRLTNGNAAENQYRAADLFLINDGNYDEESLWYEYTNWNNYPSTTGYNYTKYTANIPSFYGAYIGTYYLKPLDTQEDYYIVGLDYTQSTITPMHGQVSITLPNTEVLGNNTDLSSRVVFGTDYTWKLRLIYYNGSGELITVNNQEYLDTATMNEYSIMDYDDFIIPAESLLYHIRKDGKALGLGGRARSETEDSLYNNTSIRLHWDTYDKNNYEMTAHPYVYASMLTANETAARGAEIDTGKRFYDNVTDTYYTIYSRTFIGRQRASVTSTLSLGLIYDNVFANNFSILNIQGICYNGNQNWITIPDYPASGNYSRAYITDDGYVTVQCTNTVGNSNPKYYLIRVEYIKDFNMFTQIRGN